MFKILTNEILNESSGKKNAYIFDVDDTLLISNAKIKVWKNGKIVKELTPEEFNTYKLDFDEAFDFSDFDDEDLILRGNILKYTLKPLKNIDKAISLGKSKSEIFILTARRSSIRNAIIKFLNKHGIKNIKYDNVVCVGDWKGGTIAERKGDFLKRVSRHFDNIEFWDDDENNRKFAKSIVPDIKLHVPKK